METPLLIGLLGGSAAGAVISALFTILNSKLTWRREVRLFTAQAAVENEKWLRIESVKYIRVLASINLADARALTDFLHASAEDYYKTAEALIENQNRATEAVAALQMVLPHDSGVLAAYSDFHSKKVEFMEAMRDFDSHEQNREFVNEKLGASTTSLSKLEKKLSTYLRTNPIARAELR